jgi:four helix bundle protein
MGDYHKLKVWQASDELAIAIYRETQGFPDSERFGLRSQMRRAAVSIPSNVAEGCGRNTEPQLRQFVRIALGSANELEYQVQLASRLGFIGSEVAARVCRDIGEIKRMLAGLLKATGPS